MSDPVVRWEINSRDPLAQQRFYADVFGWTTTVVDQESGYGLVETGGTPGGIGPEPHYGTRIYVQVEDIAVALDRARAAGARYADGPVALGGFVLGVFDDPEGNRVGLVQRDSGG
jgi:predicted enzyme related to lactoylglutathione lyase